MYRLTRLSLAFPRGTLLVLALVTLMFAGGLPRLRTEFGYRVLIGDDHPSIQALDGFIERFGGGLPVQIAWECGDGHPCDSVFDDESLEMAYAVTQALAPIDGIENVQGPANAALLVPDAEGFAVRRFVEDGEPVPDAAALAVRALDDSLWVGSLVSADGTVGVIVVQPTDTESETDVRVVEMIEKVLAPFEARGFEFHMAGDATENVIGGRDLAQSTANLIPFTVLVIALIVLVLSRSWRTAAVTLGTMGIALLWTFGLLGWLHWPQDGILEVLAPLILVVGVCDAIHLLSRYAAELDARAGDRSRGERTEALLLVAKDVGVPCLITTLTTGGAFLSFTTSALDTFVRFGLIAAFGVGACLVLTFVLIPPLAQMIPAEGAPAVRASETWNSVLDAIVRTSERRAVPILLSTAVLFVVCGTGWFRYLRVDTNWLETWGEQSRVVQSIHFLEDHLGESLSLEIEIALPPGGALEDPATLQTVRGFSDFLSNQDGLGSTTSVLDLLARLNRLLHDDDPAFERPGETQGANAEILELISFDDASVLASWLSFDRSRLRVSVEAPEQSYTSMGKALESVRDYIGSELPRNWSVLLTGELAVTHDWVRDVQDTQLRSFPTALVLVLVMVAIFLGSIRLSVAAMVPTLLPVVVTLGAMGWLGLSLDVGRAMIAAIMIGIAVDDSIHLLSQYKRRRANGDSPREAMRAAMLHVGRAVVTTSVALALGFLTLMASAWQTISSFGFFVALAILGALAAALFVLPALIFAFARGDPAADLHGSAISRSPAKTRRTLVTLVAVLPVAGTIAAAALSAAGRETTSEFGCWVLPNAHVMVIPGDGRCPLGSNDRIRKVERADGSSASVQDLQTLRSAISGVESSVRVLMSGEGRERWVEVPVLRVTAVSRAVRIASAALLGGVLMCIPLFLLRRSSSPAAVPFTLLYAAVAVTGVTMIGARQSEWLMYAALLAVVTVPASLVHLNFTFLRDRKVIRDVPGLVLVPYGVSGVLLPAAWSALDRDPLLWPTFTWLFLGLTAGAGGILLLSCAYAIRESTSALERARARLLLYGAMFLPLVPTLVLARTSEPAQLTASYLWVSAVVMPLPIGLAISRYNLFNLEWDARRWVGRLVYFGTVALVVTVLLAIVLAAVGAPYPLRDPTFLFLLSFSCALAVEPLRGRLFGFAESMFSPRLQNLRRLRGDYARAIAQLRDEDDVARLLGDVLQRALGPRSGCVFLLAGAQWRPAYAFGRDAPTATDLAENALLALRDRGLLYFALDPEVDTAAVRRLHTEGVEVVTSVESGGERLGLVLLAGTAGGSPYASPDLDFVAMAASHAGIALRNAKLTEELLSAERHATTGRIAVALAHDVGKELDWLGRLVRRLPQRLDDPHRLTRDVSMIQEFTEGLTERIRDFVRSAMDATEDPAGIYKFELLVRRSVVTMSRIHGNGRITESIDPGLRDVRAHENIGRVLANLLDNALRASPEGQSVHLFATLEGPSIRISITDRGTGMSKKALRRAFDRGFTTRKDGSGSGLGLTISREIVESLSGNIELTTNPGGGTRATVVVPAAR